ncbi:DUF4352 domain-containing protein [Eupransor demetentiae]|uniref:DUF4352 domain-containing protein n=1 Tax=Eupransor demetentiae TaxID=3109584 RepID=A0ABM9N2W8_9LACO|nr:hypothetical protein R54876_GBNLAHCA_00038 [Lactobacillaceae bacterium LMG 33000]
MNEVNTTETEYHVPFYRHGWFILSTIILVVIVLAEIGDLTFKKPVKHETVAPVKSIPTSTLKVGQTADHNGFLYRVNNISYSDTDGDQKAEDGKKFVKVNVSMANKGSSDVSYNPNNFSLDDDGNQTSLGQNAQASGFTGGSLAQNDSVSGDITTQANPDDNLKLVVKVNRDGDSLHITVDLK